MYSYGGEYKETDFHNPAYLDWMENYSKEIDSVRINNIPNDSTIREWDNIINKNFPNYKAEIMFDTLIITKWGQVCYYNKLCSSNNDCNTAIENSSQACFTSISETSKPLKL